MFEFTTKKKTREVVYCKSVINVTLLVNYLSETFGRTGENVQTEQPNDTTSQVHKHHFNLLDVGTNQHKQ